MSNLAHLGNLIYQTSALVGVVVIVVGTLRTWLLDEDSSSNVKVENACVGETLGAFDPERKRTLQTIKNIQTTVPNASVSIAAEKTQLRLRKASLSTSETCVTLVETTTHSPLPMVASPSFQTEIASPETADSSLQDFLFYYDASFQPQTTLVQPLKQEVIIKQSNDSGKCLSMSTLNPEVSIMDNTESSVFLTAISDPIVDLSSRMTKEITTAQCEKLKHVVKLDLSKNHLKSLPDAFGSLESLTSLSLKENSLSDLPSSFRNLFRLEFLDLSRNNLTHLDNLLFSQMAVLSNVDLSKNRLRSIPYSLGSCFKTLTCLALDDNPLDNEVMSLIHQSSISKPGIASRRSSVSKSRSASLDSQVRPSLEDFFKKRESAQLSELDLPPFAPKVPGYRIPRKKIMDETTSELEGAQDRTKLLWLLLYFKDILDLKYNEGLPENLRKTLSENGALVDMSRTPSAPSSSKRIKAVQELLSTEETYVRQLELLLDIYVKPLRVLEILSTENFKRLFLNVEEIYLLHREQVFNSF